MKIGILTFHRAHNFGAFLQAFALKTFLEEKGHEVELVDYWPKEHAALYRFFYKEEVKSFKGFLRECVVAYYRKNKAKDLAKSLVTKTLNNSHGCRMIFLSMEVTKYGGNQGLKGCLGLI